MCEIGAPSAVGSFLPTPTPIATAGASSSSSTSESGIYGPLSIAEDLTPNVSTSEAPAVLQVQQFSYPRTAGTIIFPQAFDLNAQIPVGIDG
jgi:hypothetical protein